MKKSIGVISLALVLLTLLLSGCASTTPTQPAITPSPVPSTFTPEPTATQIPSPTAVIPVWTEINNISSLSEYPEYQSNAYWDQGLIPNTAIAFNTDTRWNFDIEVDNLGKDATGIFLNGYTGKEEGETILGQKILGLYYHSGSWHLGYAINNTYVYSWDFNSLTSPKQSFSLTVSKDGRSILINNNAEFSQEIKYQEKLFDGVEAITAGYLVSPKTKFTLSSLVIEQLVDSSLLSLAMTSLKEPYTTSFENLDISNPTEMLPFRFPNTLDWASFSTRDRHRSTLVRNGNYTLWTVDSRAHTGKYAINVVPNGNTVTKGMLPVSVAVLDPVFDVSGYDTVNLKMWIDTTSNPRVASVHNCDSGLQIYYKTDLSAPWADYTFMCGENIKESQGWHEISLDFDVKGKSAIQFAFGYEVQNITKPDPSIYYLVDDLEITAATNQASSTSIATTPTPSGYIVEQEIVVDAKKEWLDSGILINKGDIISITHISGEWRTAPTYSWTNGFDCSSSVCKDCLATGAPEASLIFKVGNGEMVCAGKSSFTSLDSGVLYLSFNDLSGWFYDNEGQITVKITITQE